MVFVFFSSYRKWYNILAGDMKLSIKSKSNFSKMFMSDQAKEYSISFNISIYLDWMVKLTLWML